MARIRQEPNRYWSKEEKIRIVKMCLEDGKSSYDIAKEEDISSGMLRRWIRKYVDLGPESLENKKKPGNPLSFY